MVCAAVSYTGHPLLLQVVMGKLEFELGMVHYDSGDVVPMPMAAQVGLAAGAAVVVLLVLVIIFMYRYVRGPPWLNQSAESGNSDKTRTKQTTQSYGLLYCVIYKCMSFLL